MPTCCVCAGKPAPKSVVDNWARLYNGIKGLNYYDLDMRWFLKGPLHVVMRATETTLLLMAIYFDNKGRLTALNQHWRSLGLKTDVFEHDGKLVLTMRGNDMREALKKGPELFDPSLSDLAYDDDSWVEESVVELFAAVMECFQRIDVTLRATPFGDGEGTKKGTFTWGLQTYIYDANFICEIILLLGNLTMTHRSMRDIVVCNLVLAVRTGFSMAIYGEDNLEARHHDQHKLTKLVTGGGRSGTTKREREQMALSKIVSMEKVSDNFGETVLANTLRRHLSTQQLHEANGFGANARFPAWRHNSLPQLALFGPLPVELQAAVEPEAPKKSTKANAAPPSECNSPSPVKRQRSTLASPSSNGPQQTPTGTASQVSASQVSDAGLPGDSPGAHSGLSASQPAAGASQPLDEGEGEGEGEHGAAEGGTGGDAFVEVYPEEEEEEEEERRRRVAAALEEQDLANAGGGEGGGEGNGEGGGEGIGEGGGEGRSDGGSRVAPTLKLPTIELRGLKSVQIGNGTYTVGGKREFKVVGPHQKLKVQADLGEKGLHKLHVGFSSICGLGLPMPTPGSSESTVAFALCAPPEVFLWDASKATTNKVRHTAAAPPCANGSRAACASGWAAAGEACSGRVGGGHRLWPDDAGSLHAAERGDEAPVGSARQGRNLRQLPGIAHPRCSRRLRASEAHGDQGGAKHRGDDAAAERLAGRHHTRQGGAARAARAVGDGPGP